MDLKTSKSSGMTSASFFGRFQKSKVLFSSAGVTRCSGGKTQNFSNHQCSLASKYRRSW